MIRCNLGYSLKNIPIPTKNTYLKSLISQTESFIKRLRWRIFGHESNGNIEEQTIKEVEKETFGFKSDKTPPQHHHLVNFENDMYNLISNIKFKNPYNDFQRKCQTI